MPKGKSRAATWQERLWENTDRQQRPGCWVSEQHWYTINGKIRSAVEWAYFAAFGVDLKRGQIEQTCKHPGCINPAHLRKR